MVDAPVRFEQSGKDDSECKSQNQTYGKNNQRIHIHLINRLVACFIKNILGIIIKGAGQVNANVNSILSIIKKIMKKMLEKENQF
jgi:hypothetical protein